MIRVSNRAGVRAIVHEFGHAWHRRPDDDALPDAVAWAAARARTRQGGPRRAAHEAIEHLADVCALAWSLGPMTS